jgi:hypothetical protein
LWAWVAVSCLRLLFFAMHVYIRFGRQVKGIFPAAIAEKPELLAKHMEIAIIRIMNERYVITSR